ncbi:hypothetical protein [Burkholderia cepacia]|uniref:hypothetical protein n=1 Tax=Burkholderia cepacia TaxID=292 RepID=UPI0007570D85|nr:hypothetical protein [Burkholderia cepacia]KVW15381.1 hypothetical protein WK91_18250 [Burkholderia cepacia]KWF90406.1 hypothetical protein WL95_27660 [Burkholderia cepacia]
MTDLHKTVEDHEIRIALLEQSRSDHAASIAELKESEKAILERLAMTATKEDVMNLRGHFDEGLNGVLRDAINAVPQHAANATASRANLWFALAGIGSLGALAVMVAEHWR